MNNYEEEEDREIMYHHGLIDNIDSKKLTRLTIAVMLLLIVVIIMVECK